MSARTRVLWTLLASLAVPHQAWAESDSDAVPQDDYALVEGHLLAERPGQAVAVCESLDVARLDAALRKVCGLAALSLGDRFAAVGQTKLARARWEQALGWDPSLADRADVLERLATRKNAPTPADVPPAPLPADGATPTPLADRNAPPDPSVAPVVDDAPITDGESDNPLIGWSRPTPPRAGRHLTLGLGAGYLDGILGFVLGWQLDPQIALQMSLGILYQTFDVRMRFLALPDALTPFVGFGLLLPLTPKDRVGLGLAPIEAIYELAEAFHIDVGLNWMVVPGLELSAGVTFVTPFDQVHPDTVVFFPQVTGGVSWIF